MSTSTQGPGPCCPPDCPTCCKGNSPHPIRYFSGRILLQTVDVDAGIPGFQHSRIFFNRNFELADWNSSQGWNWAVAEWPYLVKRVHTYTGGEQTTYVLKEGLYPRWFDLQEDGSLLARYGANDYNLLEALPGEGIFRYRLIGDGRIETIDFHDFSQPADRAGMMKRRVDANGFETTVTAYGDKTILGMETVRGGTTYRLTYAYVSGDFTGKLDSVTMESETGSVVTPLRRARYLYHVQGTTEGNEGDLKAAITQQPAAGEDAWEDIAVRYYRYTTTGKHLLTYLVGPTMYMLLKQAGQDVLTMPQSAGGPDLVPEFANNYFEYDDVNRVTREVARGDAESTGPEGLTYTRTRNPYIPHNQHTPRTAAEFNTWAWKIVEEGREGYRTIVYTNKIGQPLATVQQSLAEPARQWITAVRRNDSSATILEASPAAVARIDETLPDLIGYRDSDGSFANLRADAGLVTRTEYYSETTATATVPGGVKGYPKSRAIQQGWQGGLIPQNLRTYLASDNTSGPVTYIVGEETSYRLEEDTPDSRITLSHAYTWHAPVGQAPPRIQQEVITYPAVPEAEGGDGIAHVTKSIRDESGNIIWKMDERGVIAKYSYDVTRGLQTQEVRDADSAPSGWSLLPGPHAALTTDYAYDGLSRRVLTLGPEHEALVDASAQALRRAEFACYVETPLSNQTLFGFPVLNQIRTAGGYRLSSSGEDAVIEPVRIELQDKCERTMNVISSTRSTGSGALAPSDTFSRGGWSRWTANLYNERGLLAETRVYHAIPAASSGLDGVYEILGVEGENYGAALYRYGAETSLLISQRDPSGTFTRTVYDEISRPVGVYVGTNEVPDCASEPWSPGVFGSNLVLVQSLEYDLGQSGGDSLVTLRTDWVSSEEIRLTRFTYDFRSRETARLEEESRYVETGYDNLDHPVETRLRLGGASGNLLLREVSLFNKLGRIYEVRSYDAASVSAAYLAGIRTYDPAGNLIVSTEPGRGGLKTWQAFDLLGRRHQVLAGCTVDISSADVDLAVEQVDLTYDDASNVISQVFRRLNTGSAGATPTYRQSYTQNWFDALGRSLASADLGALGSAPARPSTPPERSDTELVSSVTYNDRAEIVVETDPLARENHFAYDDKGRRITSIENYVPGGTEPWQNRIQHFAYTPDDSLRELAIPVEGMQITRWEYGVSLDGALLASNRLLARKIYADGSVDVFSYNRQGETILRTDAHGTTRRLIYDGLGRLRHDCALALGDKIYSPVRRQTLHYDPRGFLVSAQAHNSPDPKISTLINEVAMSHDGLGLLLAQVQEHYGNAILEGDHASKALVYTREGLAGNQDRIATITYPSGQQYRLDYGAAGSLDDQLGRVVAIKEIAPGGDVTLVTYDYLGLSIVVRKSCPEPTLALDLWGGTTGSYTGLDSFSRLIDQRWTGASTDVARLQYGYDRGARRTWRLDAVARSLSKDLDEIYTYDGLSQIKTLRRGRLNTGHTDLEPETENFNEAWEYNAIGNPRHYQQGDPDAVLDQLREYNSVNEITNIDNGEDNPKWPKPRYDAAGNTTRLPGAEDPNKPFRVDYDAWNRVSRVATFDAGWRHLRVATHLYDARGRRAQSAIFIEGGTSGSVLQETWDHYYDENWRCVEEWTTQPPTPPAVPEEDWTYYSPKFRQRFVWDNADGGYIDSLVLRDRDTDADEEADERIYALQDANYNMIAISDDEGSVLCRFIYDAFGSVEFLTENFEPSATDLYLWNLLFSSYVRDPWIGLYYVRNRYYHPRLGRWLHRDPIGESGGINLYAYLSNNPLNSNDPFGLCDESDPAIITEEVKEAIPVGDTLGPLSPEASKALLDQLDKANQAASLTPTGNFGKTGAKIAKGLGIDGDSAAQLGKEGVDSMSQTQKLSGSAADSMLGGDRPITWYVTIKYQCCRWGFWPPCKMYRDQTPVTGVSEFNFTYNNGKSAAAYKSARKKAADQMVCKE